MTTVPMEPVAAPEPRWRALRGTNLADRLYRGVLTTLALLMPLLLLALVGELATSAWPAIQRFGLSFLWTSVRSEEHTSELQSRSDLVCRLLLEKKKKKHTTI